MNDTPDSIPTSSLSAELDRSQGLVQALFDISELSMDASDPELFYAALHGIVDRLIYSKNFLIGLKPPGQDFRFEYFVDSVDSALTPTIANQRSQDELDATLTAHVVRTGLLFHIDQESTDRVADFHGIKRIGTQSVDWLGVPLKRRNGACVGAIVIQSYDPSIVYSAADEQILTFVCAHVAGALEAQWADRAIRTANLELEERMERRSKELLESNRRLETEVVERQRNERLQQVLFQIASLAGEPMPLDLFYKRIHGLIGELIYAGNLFIALQDFEHDVLEFVYCVDLIDDHWDPIKIPENLGSDDGPSLTILKTGRPLLYRDGREQLPRGAIGPRSVAWLGVPLGAEDEVIGVLAVQSYDQNISYDERDMELLTFVAQHVGTTIARRRNKLALEDARRDLERRVEQRTQDLTSANDELRNALATLESAQRQLVESEKMASLGALVAGVAHEINTPLGVALTAGSFLQNECRKLAIAMGNATMDQETAATRLEKVSNDASALLLSNLDRAAKLVASFKQVAADQSTEDRRRFDLASYLDEVMTSLRPRIRKAGHRVRLTMPARLEIHGFPFIIYRIVSNLVVNSIVHGFAEGDHGVLELELRAEDDEFELLYSDDGRGMEPHVLEHLYDPFFTTLRGRGGTGLGMHIVYNHVVKLGGTIHCDSEVGNGVHFRIRLAQQS